MRLWLKVIGILVFVSVLVFRGAWIGYKYQTGDESNAITVSEGLAEESFPEWNPYIFSGMPAFASLSYYSPWLYPFNWLHLIVQTPRTWMFQAHIFHLILGAIGFILFFRLKHRASVWLVLFGGISFAFSLQLIGFEIYGQGSKAMSIAYVPWIFWAIERIKYNDRWRDYSVLALIIGLQLLRSHFQVCYYTWMFAVPYAIMTLRGGQKMKENYIKAGLGFIVGAALAAILIWPVLQYASISTRSGGMQGSVVSDWSMSISELTTMFMPLNYGYGGADYVGSLPITEFPPFVGILVFIAGIYGAFQIFRSNKKQDRYFVFAFLFACLIAVGNSTPIYQVFVDLLPGFNKFRASSMILGIAQFFISYMAVVGMLRAFERNWTFKFAGAVIGCGFAIMIFYPMLLGNDVDARVEGINNRVQLIQDNIVQNKKLNDAQKNQLNIEMRNLNIEKKRITTIDDGVTSGLFFLAIGAIVFWVSVKNRNPYIAIFYGVLEILFAMSPMPGVKKIDLWREDALVNSLKTDKGVFRVLMLPPLDDHIAQHGIELVTGYHAAKPKDYQELLDKTEGFTKVDRKSLMHLNVKYIVSAYEQKSLGDPIGKTWTWHYGDKLSVLLYQVSPFVPRAGTDKFAPVVYRRIDTDHFEVEPYSPVMDSTGKNVVDARFESQIFVSERALPGWECKTDGGQDVPIQKNGVCMKVDVPVGTKTLMFEYKTPMLRTGATVSSIALLLIFIPFADWLRKWWIIFSSLMRARINFGEKDVSQSE